jgi:2-polyprenyl-3-methyl-5-hydroxy-6-metoxy-1,4-benzoquinol methylase
MTSIHSGESIAERDSLSVIECRECGFAHLADIPSPEVLARYYSSDFWNKDKLGWRERYEAQADWLEATHGDWLSLAEYCSFGRTLMDIGCGWGFFLKTAQKRGWLATGVEPDRDAAAYAIERQMSVYHGTWEQLDSVPVTAKQWDCIAALWLIEHLPDPLSFLRWARTHLYGNGVLLLACPNEWTDLQERANRIAAVKEYFIHHTHINYFSASSLANLLGRAGFMVVDQLGTYPMEKHILGGKDYTAEPVLGEEAHALVRKIDLAQTREQRLEFGRALGRKGMGRDMVMICRPV